MNRKYILPLIAFITLVVLFIGIIVSIFLNKTPSVQLNNVTQNNTISESDKQQSNNGIAFTVNPSTIDTNNPYSEINLAIKSSITNITTSLSVLNKSTELLSGNGIVIIISAGGEGNPIGLNSPIPEVETISNSQFKSVKRLNYSNDSQLKAYFSNYNLDYKYHYVYSTSINTNSDCMPGAIDIYCGIEYLKIDNSQNTPLYIRCGVNDLSNVKYCDEFVANLEVQ